jgi:hypothetical protein
MFFIEGGNLMKKKIITIVICLLVSFSFLGTISSLSLKKKLIDYNPINPDFTHTVIGEIFLNSTHEPCKYLNQALIELYDEEWYPFYYVTYLFDKNNNSNDRKDELGVTESPTVVFDGGYEKISLAINDTEQWKLELNESFNSCGARDVKDINLLLDVKWHGAVNPYPEDGETDIPIEVIIGCSISEMEIDVEATNIDSSEYNGHIHVQVTEVESEWYEDKFGNPYTFEFKDYAYNDDVQIDAGDIWNETIIWDGCDYHDGDDPPRYFDHILQDNIMIFATAMNKDLNNWVDETAGILAGVNTDPKTFDFYFGDSNPPPKVLSNVSVLKYDYPGSLNWTTTYYWKVDVRNNLGELLEGDVWSFTTRGNSPPNEPVPIYPPNGAENIPICFELQWNCSDPDGDDLTYDIYFGDCLPPPLIENNWSGNGYDPSPFGPYSKFNTTFYWKIVAWDPYGLNSTGGIWSFKTEPNYPPNPAKDPIPPNGSQGVPPNATFISWNGSDPNLCDFLLYDVYFGLTNPPPLQVSNQTENYYDPYGPDEMPLFERFYWRIVTWDKSGESSDSGVWWFETGINFPPFLELDCPPKWPVGKELCLNISSTDPENHSVRFIIDWGDGTFDETEYYAHNFTIEACHTYEEKGVYIIIIRVKAIDIYGETSNWEECEIEIPRNRVTYNMLFQWILDQFPIIKRFLNFYR